MGVLLQTKKMDLSLLELESTTLNPTKPPQNKVKPGGTRISKNRAKLAGIAAAWQVNILILRQTALVQIRNSILYPQRMPYLYKPSYTIWSEGIIHIYKIEAHAGILGKNALMP